MRPVRQNCFAVCLCAARRCCVVRIADECFLDCSLQEFFMFLEWRTAFSQNHPRLQYHSSFCFCRGQLAPCLEDALPLCPFWTFPHTVGNHPHRAEPARPQLPAARCLRPISKNNSNKKAEYVFSVLCFCLLCDIRNPKPCICHNLNQGIICNRMG